MAEWNYAEWAEKAGIENLKHRLGTGDVLLAQANTLLSILLLSILLVGIGGGMSYAIKLAEPGATVAASALWGGHRRHGMDGMGGCGAGVSVHRYARNRGPRQLPPECLQA